MLLIFVLLLTQGAQTPPAVALDVQIRPFLELYFSQRATPVASDQATPSSPAVQLALSLIDATAVDCENADAFLRACDKLPESIERAGQTIPVRDLALPLARRLAAMAKENPADLSAQALRSLDSRKQAIETAFKKYPTLVASAVASLEISNPTATVPVVIVSAMPSPGAATFRDSQGRSVSVIGAGSLEGSDLIETVLHELLHAVDAMSSKDQTGLNRLRGALTDAGVAARTAADCVHAVIFAQAAASVRRVADSAHTPVGARPSGPYSRMSKPAQDAVAIWTAHCNGTIDTPTAIARIVAAAKTTSGLR